MGRKRWERVQKEDDNDSERKFELVGCDPGIWLVVTRHDFARHSSEGSVLGGRCGARVVNSSWMIMRGCNNLKTRGEVVARLEGNICFARNK